MEADGQGQPGLADPKPVIGRAGSGGAGPTIVTRDSPYMFRNRVLPGRQPYIPSKKGGRRAGLRPMVVVVVVVVLTLTL